MDNDVTKLHLEIEALQRECEELRAADVVTTQQLDMCSNQADVQVLAKEVIELADVTSRCASFDSVDEVCLLCVLLHCFLCIP